MRENNLRRRNQRTQSSLRARANGFPYQVTQSLAREYPETMPFYFGISRLHHFGQCRSEISSVGHSAGRAAQGSLRQGLAWPISGGLGVPSCQVLSGSEPCGCPLPPCLLRDRLGASNCPSGTVLVLRLAVQGSGSVLNVDIKVRPGIPPTVTTDRPPACVPSPVLPINKATADCRLRVMPKTSSWKQPCLTRFPTFCAPSSG